MKRSSFESMPCPMARALEHLSDGWNVLILREAFYGATRFDEFETGLGIATNTLSRRLKDLVAGGLLARRQYSSNPPRYEYLLTDKGRDLRPVMLALLEWGNKYEPRPGNSVVLTDTETGKPVVLQLIDAVTGERISARHKVRRRQANGKTVESFPFPENVRH